jgi:arylsulfatase A-like enzyme
MSESLRTSTSAKMSLPPAEAVQPVEPPATEAVRARLTLGPASAQLAAWGALAVVNAVAIGQLKMPVGGFRVRAMHHLYDAGQLIALGLVVAGAVAAWGRIGPRRPVWGYAACAAASIAAAFVVLQEDLTGLAQQLARSGSSEPWHVGLTGLAGLSVPLAALVGRALARRWLRLVGCAFAAGAAIANHLLLRHDYAGIHAMIAIASASLGGSALGGATLPWRAPPSPRLRRVAVAAGAAACAAASIAVLIRPSNAVGIELFLIDGAIVAPLLARARQADVNLGADVPPEVRVWFADRSNLPDVAPSEPPLVARDAVVLFLSIDAARADVFADDAHAAILPTLTDLRRRGVTFTRARSAAPQTYVSLATIFCGKYYSQQLWTLKAERGRGTVWPHEDPSIRFPELLSKAGAATITFASADYLVNEHGILRGFTEERFIKNTPAARELVQPSIDRIERHAGGPLFLFLHFLDAHYPYNRAGKAGDPPFARYVGEIGVIDKQIGLLLQAIERRGLGDKTVVFVTADHGEAFGEHDTTQHATTIYDELLRVPLFVVVPGVRPRLIDEPVSLVDLGPTILDLMGIPTPGSFMGQSLTPYLRGENPTLRRPIVADSGRLMQAMVFPDGIKVIRDARRSRIEVYDLTQDPGEKKNLYGEDADQRIRERVAQLVAFLGVHKVPKRGYKIPYRR